MAQHVMPLSYELHAVYDVYFDAVHVDPQSWIARIEGSYTGIMGLPLHETAALLARAGIDVRP